MTERAPFESAETQRHLASALQAQVSLLREAVPALRAEHDNVFGASVTALILGICESVEALTLLAEHGRFRDALVTSRTIFETCVNACFILAEGDDAAERAKLHALQKSVRDLDREVTSANWTTRIWTPLRAYFEDNPDVQRATETFTTKKGAELRRWTPESIPERIASIAQGFGNRTGLALHFGLVAIYRHSSEIAHGTVFGILWERGLTQPEPPLADQEALSRHQGGYLSLALMMSGLAVMAVNSALGATLDSELGDRSFQTWRDHLALILPDDVQNAGSGGGMRS